MHITSAEFIKGIVGPDRILNDSKPQVAFIGRSNVGKSSTINSLTGKRDLARISSAPGRTRQINLFLINQAFYLVDLPGYGFAKGSHQEREDIHQLIEWYLFDSEYTQKKVVLIIDASVGITENDMDMLSELEKKDKDIVIVANKVDRLKQSAYQKQLQAIKDRVGNHIVIPYSAEKKIGIGALTSEILKR